MRHALRFVVVASVLAAAAASAAAQVVTYPAPPGINLSGDYTVRVGGKPVAVYRGEGTDSRAPHLTPQVPYSFAYFDYSGSALVQITSIARPLSNVVVRPASKGVVPSIAGNSMSFTLTQNYCHLSIEPDAKKGPLLLFANPIEVNPPTPSTPGVVYFGPGLHRPAGGVIYLADNQTLYLAGGAVVQAAVDIIGKSNVKIRGRGIMDGLPWTPQLGPTGPNRSWRGEPMILAKNCANLSLDGIILKDSWRFNVGVYSTSLFTATNVKIVSVRGENEDGIDFFNTQRVTISDSFLRTDDSTIALLVNWTSAPTTDVTVTRCSLWTDRAECFLIGATGYWGTGVKLGVPAPPMSGLRFVDNDVLHYYYRAIMLSGNHNQVLEDVRFENIRINHEGQGLLLQVQPAANADPQTASPIRNVLFKDIVTTGNAGNYGQIRVTSTDSTSPVSNVTFQNVVRRGQLALRTSPEVVVGSNTSNIVFIASQTGNQPPTVSLSTNGTSFTAPASIALAANAADSDGTVSKVGFYRGTTLLGEDTTSPYALTWSNVPAGTYSVIAKATDNGGAVGSSVTVTVTVTSGPVASAPWGGTAWPIPGRIDAKNYDTGGPGVAYSDTTPANQGGRYRPGEGVDLWGPLDGNDIVGATRAGEWLQYTVNVAATGTYTLQARVSSIDSGGVFHLELDGANVSGPITMGAGASPLVWQTLTKPGINLTAGLHKLRLVLDSLGTQGSEVANLNYLSFGAVAAKAAVASSEVPAAITVNGQGDYPTVQDAILAATPGDTVNLGALRYPVSQGLSLKGGVSIKGVAPHLTILDGQGAAFVIRLAGTAVEGKTVVEGLTITGGVTGIDTGSADVHLKNLQVVQNSGDGIMTGQQGNVEGVSLTVADNGGEGIRALTPDASFRGLVLQGNMGGSVSGTSMVTHSSFAGVTFENPSTLDYREKAGSSSIDGGDPADPYDLEPEPSGGRINRGAFGNTPHAATLMGAGETGSFATGSGGSSGEGGACGATGMEVVLAVLVLGLRRIGAMRRSARASAAPG